MNSFVSAVQNQSARTENGMRARKSTASACVDLFFKIGASRGKDVTKDFVAAYAENPEVALRIAQWVRDVRGGAGEREVFRQILTYLDKHNPNDAARLLVKVPEIGRWDDIFVLKNKENKYKAFAMLGDALRAKSGLAAKWTPRKGELAVEIRNFFGMSPKFYRKSLVELTKVVETAMCAKDWDNINFNHVPSVASSRYKKAFARHTEKYKEWAAALVSTDPEVKASVKVNAGAIFPHDVIKQLFTQGWSESVKDLSVSELQHIEAQWDALPKN